MPVRPATPKNLPEISSLLKSAYSDFAHHNYSDPLDELLFIMCSVMTTESSYRYSYKKLRSKFRDHDDFVGVSESDIAEPLFDGGLYGQRASAIKSIVDILVEKFGRPTLDPLRNWPDDEVEDFLVQLPRVGKKVARCVMLYSLDRDVFPVDTHCWRIARRIGWVRRTHAGDYVSNKDMERLQAKVPPELRFSLHVNLVSHGRAVCKHRNPQCGDCMIAHLCHKVGVRRKK